MTNQNTKKILSLFQHCESLNLITEAPRNRGTFANGENIQDCIDEAADLLDTDKLIDDYGLDEIREKYPDFADLLEKEREEDEDEPERELGREVTDAEEETADATAEPKPPEKEATWKDTASDTLALMVGGEHKGGWNDQVPYESQGPAGQAVEPDKYVDVGYFGKRLANGNTVVLQMGDRQKRFTLRDDNSVIIDNRRFSITTENDNTVFAGWERKPQKDNIIDTGQGVLHVTGNGNEAVGLWTGIRKDQRVGVIDSAYHAKMRSETQRQSGRFIPESEIPHEDAGGRAGSTYAPYQERSKRFMSGAAQAAGIHSALKKQGRQLYRALGKEGAEQIRNIHFSDDSINKIAYNYGAFLAGASSAAGGSAVAAASLNKYLEKNYLDKGTLDKVKGAKKAFQKTLADDVNRDWVHGNTAARIRKNLEKGIYSQAQAKAAREYLKVYDSSRKEIISKLLKDKSKKGGKDIGLYQAAIGVLMREHGLPTDNKRLKEKLKTATKEQKEIAAAYTTMKKAGKKRKAAAALAGKTLRKVDGIYNKAQQYLEKYAGDNAAARGAAATMRIAAMPAAAVKTAMRAKNIALATGKAGKLTINIAAKAGSAGAAAVRGAAEGIKFAKKNGIKAAVKAPALKAKAKAEKIRSEFTVKKAGSKVAKATVWFLKKAASVIGVMVGGGLAVAVIIILVALTVMLTVLAMLNFKGDEQYYDAGDEAHDEVVQNIVDILTDCQDKFKDKLTDLYGGENGSGTAFGDSTTGNSSVVAAANTINSMMLADIQAGNKWTYSNTSTGRSTSFDGARNRTDTITTSNGVNGKKKISGNRTTNCAAGVGYVLQQAGVLKKGQNFWGSKGGGLNASARTKAQMESTCEVIRYGGSKTVKQLISSGDLLPGDVVTYMNVTHTNMYLGDGTWFDSGHLWCTPSTGDGAVFKKWVGKTHARDSMAVGYVVRPKSAGSTGSGSGGSTDSNFAMTSGGSVAAGTDSYYGYPQMRQGNSADPRQLYTVTAGTWQNFEMSWSSWNPDASSAQYKVKKDLEKNHTIAPERNPTDGGTYAVVDGKYYLAAFTLYWGKCGDAIRVDFDSGKTMYFIIADIKAYVHTGYPAQKEGLYGHRLPSNQSVTRDLAECFYFGSTPSGLNNRMGTPVKVTNLGAYTGDNDDGAGGTTQADIMYVQDITQSTYKDLIDTTDYDDEEEEGGDDSNKKDRPKNIYMYGPVTDEKDPPEGITPTPVPSGYKKGDKVFSFYNNNQEIVSMVMAMFEFDISSSTSTMKSIYLNSDAESINGGKDSDDTVSSKISDDSWNLAAFLKDNGLDFTDYSNGTYDALIDYMTVGLFNASHIVTETPVIEKHQGGCVVTKIARDAEGNYLTDEDGEYIYVEETIPCPGHAKTSVAVTTLHFDALFDLQGWWQDHIYAKKLYPRKHRFDANNPGYPKADKDSPLKSTFQRIMMPTVEVKISGTCNEEGSSRSYSDDMFENVTITSEESKQNLQTIYNFLRNDMGLTKAQAAGILGNMYQEDHAFAPECTEHNGGGGYGIIQWTGGRRDNLVNWCNTYQMTHPLARYNTLAGQLAFLKHECEENDGWVGGSYTGFKMCSTAESAAEYFVRYNEQPGNIEEEVAKRQKFARQFMDAIDRGPEFAWARNWGG